MLSLLALGFPQVRGKVSPERKAHKQEGGRERMG